MSNDNQMANSQWSRYNIGLVLVLCVSVNGIGLGLISVLGIRAAPEAQAPAGGVVEAPWKPIMFSPPGGYDAGNSFVGEDATFRVVVKNISDETLKIQRVVSSCNCTVIEFDKHTIAPQGSAVLTGSIRSAPIARGQIVTVEFDTLGFESGRNVQLKYPIEARFVSSIAIQQDITDFTPVEQQLESASAGSITLNNVSARRIAVLVTPYHTDRVDVSTSEFSLEPRASQVIAVEVRGSDDVDAFANISVDAGREFHMVPLKLRVAGRTRVSPSILVLGAISKEGGKSSPAFQHASFFKGNWLVRMRLSCIRHPQCWEGQRYQKLAPTRKRLNSRLWVCRR